MKKIVLALVAVFTITCSAFAQNNGGMRQQFSQEDMAKFQTERMATQLGLDEAQKAAVLKLNMEFAGKMRRGMGPMGGPRMQRNDSVKADRPNEAQMKEMRKQMEENQAAFKAELKKVLTEEQFAKYEEMEKLQMQMFRRGGMNGGPRGMGGPRR